MTTPNLAIPLIVASQSHKEVTANAAFSALDRAVTGTFVADVAAGNVTLTATQYREALGVRVINATVPGRAVALPQVERYSIISVDEATSTEGITVQRGTTSVVVSAGGAALIRTDGTANGLAVILQGADGAAGDLLALSDTPDSYAGQALRMLRVNSTEDGLEFTEAGGSGAETFPNLTNTPSSYAGQAGRAVVVAAGETGLGFGVPTTPVVTHADPTLAPALTQAGQWFRCTSACTITLPADATTAFPVGTSLTFSQASAGALTFAVGAGATVNVAATHLASTNVLHAVVQATKLAANTWVLFGNLRTA
ncbi:hypothetical protein [Falsiroseomonas oryzae]|uniref:hypothetical protein n=1 Tax=Falsiroseomonas oryzae TaxID=2766473 RepID=UPI0022EADDE3|nr:hypothetical protein [Roseomonas sp. MO-31]